MFKISNFLLKKPCTSDIPDSNPLSWVEDLKESFRTAAQFVFARTAYDSVQYGGSRIQGVQSLDRSIRFSNQLGERCLDEAMRLLEMSMKYDITDNHFRQVDSIWLKRRERIQSPSGVLPQHPLF